MPRVRVRRTEKGLQPTSQYEEAYKEVIENGESIRAAASKHKLHYVSLSRFIKKKKEAIEQGSTAPVTMGYRCIRRVFDNKQEKVMEEYIIKAAHIFYGLPPKEIRKLAFQLGQEYLLNMPETWRKKGMAGEDWFSGFMRRNPEISIRCAQATSLSRATSFNVRNVNHFYDNLAKVMDKYKFEANIQHFIYNIDETGVTTVQKPAKVVAEKGTRQVGSLTSGERGTLVTVALAVNAIGNSVPPIFIFPRKRYQDHFIRDGPVGCIGAGNGSGWMQEGEFLLYLNHFKKHTNVSVEKKVLLLLDNHQSHISICCLNFCKNNGIVVLSFPPHCSHRLQPLDRSVYGPFKKAVNSSSDAWMRNNPGKTMSIYDIPSIVKQALPLALTQSNIVAGFSCTGICPFNRNIFTSVDFAQSYVTDRPDPSKTTASLIIYAPQENSKEHDSETMPSTSKNNVLQRSPTPNNQILPSSPNIASSSQHENTKEAESESVPSTSKTSISTCNELAHQGIFSPETVRPLPKALPRKGNAKRKSRKSTIYTETPEKDAIQQEYDSKKKKAVKKKITKQNEPEAGSRSTKKAKQSCKQQKDHQKNSDEESEENEFYCLICLESYSNSRSGEKWVQCIDCKLWSHEECTNQEDLYVCHNCLSE